MRQLSSADLIVVLGVAVLLWLGRSFLPDMPSPARVHPERPARDTRQKWDLARHPLFWVLVGLLALLAAGLATLSSR